MEESKRISRENVKCSQVHTFEFEFKKRTRREKMSKRDHGNCLKQLFLYLSSVRAQNVTWGYEIAVNFHI